MGMETEMVTAMATAITNPYELPRRKIGLLPYQWGFSTDPCPFIIGHMGRQEGKSFAVAARAFRRLKEGRNQILGSMRMAESLRLMGKLQAYYDFYCSMAQARGMEPMPAIVRNKTTLKLANGAEAQAVCGDKDAYRGPSGDLSLDELAFNRYQDEILGSAGPIISQGYGITITSTGLGESGAFWEIITNHNNKYPHYSRHIVPLVSHAGHLGAIEQGCPTTEEFCRMICPDPDDFRREYLCEFVDEADAYLPWNLLRQQVAGDPWDGKIQGDAVLGVDLGRKRDLFAIVLLDRYGNNTNPQHSVRAIKRIRGAKFQEMYDCINEWMTTYHCSQCYIDDTGMGNKLVEDLQDPNKTPYASRVQGIQFTLTWKQQVAGAIKAALETQRLWLYDSSEIGLQALLNACHAIKREALPGGGMRIDAARTNDGHADEFWALALALDAASNVFHYYAAGRRI